MHAFEQGSLWLIMLVGPTKPHAASRQSRRGLLANPRHPYAHCMQVLPELTSAAPLLVRFQVPPESIARRA
jgi:hypothetical protein